MKQGHLMVMFLTVYVICFMALYVEQKKYDKVLEEKRQVELALLEAAYVAAESYEKVINAKEEIRKNTVSDVFLESLYVSMNKFESEEAKNYLGMYIPLLVLAEEDGAFFFYVQEIETNGTVELKHAWTEKVLYQSSGEHNVLNIIETTASELVSKHNHIASQFGISYQFHAPKFLQSTSKEMQLPMLFVVFQGWPLCASREVRYENCIDVSVYIREKEKYVVLGPETITEPFCVYHKPFCPLINKNSTVVSENVIPEEALKRYGAYPCEQCIKE